MKFNGDVTILDSLIITPLLKAHQTLKKAITQQTISELERDGTIQRFEFTYELFWKTLKKILKHKGIIVNSPRDVFRIAAKEGLVEEPIFWFEVIKKRNMTTHIYQEKYATEVFAFIPEFEKKLSIVIEKIKKL